MRTFFKKMEHRFIVENTKIENATFSYTTALSEANVKTNRTGSTEWACQKERSFVSNYFIFFWKFCFSLRTLYVINVYIFNVIAYLNASVNFTALLTNKPDAWQISFTADKGFKNSFSFLFPIIKLALQKGSKKNFLSSTNLSWRKA